MSPELHYIIKGGTFACSFSAILGGIISANQARDDYMRRNTATQFESEHLARVSIYIIKVKLPVANPATQTEHGIFYHFFQIAVFVLDSRKKLLQSDFYKAKNFLCT